MLPMMDRLVDKPWTAPTSERDSKGYLCDPYLTCIPADGAIIIFDTEFTCWEDSLARDWSGVGEAREVFQIGAVKVDTLNQFKVLAHFTKLVKPTRNPVLSPYAETLTGVTNGRLAQEGVSLKGALADFIEFCRGSGWVCSNGGDGPILRESMALAELPIDQLWNVLPRQHLFDLRPLICAGLAVEGKAGNSSNLWRALGEKSPPGQAHDALADAIGIANALRWMAIHRPKIDIRVSHPGGTH